MMEHVKDDFYVDDEPLDEVQRAWDTGAPVLVIPSRLRRQLRQQADKLTHLLDRKRQTERRTRGD
jgi:uncharacterized LabA/DUF88 family protein